jgi:hypothetical protein
LYDPLTGKMDVVFSTGGRMHFDGVGMKNTNGEYELNGQVLEGAAVVSSIQALPSSTVAADHSSAADSLYYVGTFTGGEAYLVYHAAAQLTFRGEEGQNPASNVFPVFPKMTLLVYICGQNDVYGRMIFDAVSTNSITSRVLFRQAIGSQNMDYDVVYSGALASLTGPIVSPQSAHGNSGRMSRLDLHAVPAATWKGCR